MQWRPFVLAGALCVASAARASTAQADDQEPPEPPPKVYWHDEWPRFSLAELFISAAVTARNADLGGALDGPNSATIKFEVPGLDPWTRGLLRGRTPQVVAAATHISDTGFRTLVFAPYVIDVGIGALLVNRNPDVALQLALIDFEVLTLAGMTQLLGSRIIGRARPYVHDCDVDPASCTGGPYRSFLSGHAMASFTAAGLICRHHAELPLFGGGAPDTWACVWAVSLASLTSTFRIVADQHWASDVLIGAGAGWMFGYYLPKLLHFQTKHVNAKSAITWTPTFTGSAEQATIGIGGLF